MLSNRQHGYRQGRSTATAVLGLLEIINSKLEKTEKTVILFLDLSKAFDCVSHELLLKKVARYGLRGKSRDWIKSCL